MLWRELPDHASDACRVGRKAFGPDGVARLNREFRSAWREAEHPSRAGDGNLLPPLDQRLFRGVVNDTNRTARQAAHHDETVFAFHLLLDLRRSSGVDGLRKSPGR